MSTRTIRNAQTETSPRTQDFVRDFDDFWGRVEKAEFDIRQNAHLGRLPPYCIGDPWDEDFAASYKRIRSLLKKFRRHRYYSVPPGLMFAPVPLKTETAHEAIMHFLNPPKELYGDAHALDSREYTEMKREAMAELSDRDTTRLKRLVKPKTSSVTASKDIPPWDLLVFELLKLHHKIESDTPVYEPYGTQDRIASAFRKEQSRSTVSQPTISRAIGNLFDESIDGLRHLSPMSRYIRLCDRKLICTHLRRIERRMFPDQYRDRNIDDFDGFSDRGY